MNADMREVAPGVLAPDPLASPVPARRRRVLNALVSARRAGDHELANRLLGELVDLNEAEKKEIENG